MNKDNFLRTDYNSPFIPQRADPYILNDHGNWYFTASVPEYDRVVLRRAGSLQGLKDAQEKVVWRAHPEGVMSRNIWAPEIRCVRGQWVIYFAAGEKDDIFRIRPWALVCAGDDPMRDPWTEAGQVRPADEFSFRDFSLDMTVFEHGERLFCVWAEKVSVGKKISNLYIAEMTSPVELKTPQMLLTSPAYAWERHGFWVNEGPTVIEEGGRIFLTYSASDTSAAYCMGMVWMDSSDDPMDIGAWHRVNRPVLATDMDKGMLGPGHNTFFRDGEGQVFTSFHARNYDEIEGDPLYDPNRHCYVMKVPFRDGFPVFDYENLVR